MDRVWLGLVCGLAVFLLWFSWAGIAIAAVVGGIVFAAAIAGIFHSEWSRG